MSKHSDAEDKLAVAKKLREQIRSHQEAIKQKTGQSINRDTADPSDKGTNANNQFR